MSDKKITWEVTFSYSGHAVMLVSASSSEEAMKKVKEIFDGGLMERDSIVTESIDDFGDVEAVSGPSY